MDYVFHLLILIAIYSILAVSLNILVGFAGLFSLAHAAFFGIGAYVSALLTLRLGFAFLPAAAVAIVLAMSLGVLLAVVTLKMGGDYFVLAVLGFQIMTLGVFTNWVSVTNGPFGLYGIANPTPFGIAISSNLRYFLFYGLLAALSYALIARLLGSPFGRVLKAMRDDELAIQVLGKNPIRMKLTVFAISGGFAALAGCLYAFYFTTLSPLSFSLNESVLIVSMVVVGGCGSLAGSIVGATLLVLFPEALRFLGIPGDTAAPIQQMVYGLLLLGMMLFRPQGIIGEYKI